jgi:hypothetical protein
MQLRCKWGLGVLLMACAEKPAPSPDEASARAVFERYVELGARNDPALAELYADAARIRILRVLATGKTQRLELDGAQWKRNIVTLSRAPSHEPSSTYSHVSVHPKGERMLILAERYSPSKCRTDDGYSMAVARDARGVWRIVEQYSEAWEASACGGKEEPKPLHQQLSEIESSLKPVLPLELDLDNRLDSIRLEGTRLVYGFTRLRSQEPGASDRTCDNPVLRAVITAGGSIESHYVDRQGKPLGSTLVERCPAP